MSVIAASPRRMHVASGLSFAAEVDPEGVRVAFGYFGCGRATQRFGIRAPRRVMLAAERPAPMRVAGGSGGMR
jgi:hypothetical protein